MCASSPIPITMTLNMLMLVKITLKSYTEPFSFKSDSNYILICARKAKEMGYNTFVMCFSSSSRKICFCKKGGKGVSHLWSNLRKYLTWGDVFWG